MAFKALSPASRKAGKKHTGSKSSKKKKRKKKHSTKT